MFRRYWNSYRGIGRCSEGIGIVTEVSEDVPKGKYPLAVNQCSSAACASAKQPAVLSCGKQLRMKLPEGPIRWLFSLILQSKRCLYL